MVQVKPSIHRSLFSLLGPAHFGCHDMQVLGRSPVKRRQCPDMAMALLTRTLSHSSKQTNNLSSFMIGPSFCIWLSVTKIFQQCSPADSRRANFVREQKLSKVLFSLITELLESSTTEGWMIYSLLCSNYQNI